MNVYIGSACGLVGQVECCEGIYWECMWIFGTGRALRIYILRVLEVWWNT